MFTLVGFIDWLDGWGVRIRRLCCGIFFPRPGLGINKSRNIRRPLYKPHRKDEMSEDVRHLCTERVKARHRLCESHAYVQSGKEMVRRDHDFPKTKQAKSECEPRS